MSKDCFGYLTTIPASDLNFKNALPDAPLEILNDALDHAARAKAKGKYNAIRSEIKRRYAESSIPSDLTIPTFDESQKGIEAEAYSDGIQAERLITGLEGQVWLLVRDVPSRIILLALEKADADRRTLLESELQRRGIALAAAPVEIIPAGQISEGEMSQELSGQYKKAVGGLKDVLVFGGMMIAAEVFLTRENNSAKRGPSAKGGGLKGWIEKNCPDIHYKTAMRFKTLAEHLRTEFKLADQVDLVHLLTAPIEELPKPEQKTRTDIEKFVEGKSPRQLMLDFGYASTKKTVKTEDPPEKTPEEKFKEAMEAIHNRHENAFSALATILELGEFKALADVDLQKLNDIADAWLEKTRAWLKTPKKDRIPFAIAQEAAE